MISAIGGPTELSDGSNPSFSAFVESERRSRIPLRPIDARAGRSVGRPSMGVGSSLKSPEWITIPSGVSKAIADASGTEWLTGIIMNLKGPCSIHFFLADGSHVGLDAEFVDPPTRQFHRQLGPIDRDRDVTQEVGQGPHVIFVTVGNHDTLDILLAFDQPGPVRGIQGRRPTCPLRETSTRCRQWRSSRQFLLQRSCGLSHPDHRGM